MAKQNDFRLPLNEETSAIYNLVADIRDKRAADADLIGLTPWLDKLDADNREYEALVTGGDAESLSLQTEANAKQARKLLSDTYVKITDRVDAYIVIEEAGPFAEFAQALNVKIDRYNNILAARRGRAAANKKKKEEDPTDDTPMQPADPTPRSL